MSTTNTVKTVDKTVSLELVKTTVTTLVGFLCEDAAVTCTLEPVGRQRRDLKVQITTEESRRLIGQHGATLQALQHLVRLLVSGQTGRPCFATVDVNDYKAKREQQIIDLAREAAEKATRTDNMVILRPMTSFERRLVHVALQERPEVTTESLGQEPNRRVVIKPKHESRVVKSFAQKGFTLDDIKL
ncbi:MAG: R3H domain-containing nucleic acid-binding protein [Candidatus Andersenbacteria bacterium]